MLYPCVDAKTWADIYNLEVPDAICKKCNCVQTFNQPFAFKDFRGLLSNHTVCGEEFRQSVFTVANKKERLELAGFVKQLASAL